MKPYLALFRAGDSSLHRSAIGNLAEQNFDYALSWFGDTPPDAPDAVFVDMQKGPKWAGLAATLERHRALIDQYRYVWLPDDDLLCTPADVSRMFLVCEDLGLELAQPALTIDSYYSHIVTLQHAEFQLRFTNFVEIMAPVLSAAMLQRVAPAFATTVSGWGLDALWPRMTQLGRIAIIDDTPVKHTRPVGGPSYQFSRKAGLSPNEENWMNCATHFVDHQDNYHINYGGLLANGDAICIGQSSDNDVETLLTALIASASHLNLTATQLTRYLANHLHFARGDENTRGRYPKQIISLVLDRAVRHSGIRFMSPRARAPAADLTPTAAQTATSGV